jgi:hypothetical protein
MNTSSESSILTVKCRASISVAKGTPTDEIWQRFSKLHATFRAAEQIVHGTRRWRAEMTVALLFTEPEESQHFYMLILRHITRLPELLQVHSVQHTIPASKLRLKTTQLSVDKVARELSRDE